MHLHAITWCNNQNSTKCEVNFWLEIQNYELKEYGFLKMEIVQPQHSIVY